MSGQSNVELKDTAMEKLVVEAYKMAKKPLHRKIRKKQFVVWAKSVLTSDPSPCNFSAFVAKFNVSISNGVGVVPEVNKTPAPEPDKVQEETLVMTTNEEISNTLASTPTPSDLPVPDILNGSSSKVKSVPKTAGTEAAPAVESVEAPAATTEAAPAVKSVEAPAATTEAAPAVESVEAPAATTEAAPAVESVEAPAATTEAAPAVESVEAPAATTEAASAVESVEAPAATTEASPSAELNSEKVESKLLVDSTKSSSEVKPTLVVDQLYAAAEEVLAVKAEPSIADAEAKIANAAVYAEPVIVLETKALDAAKTTEAFKT